MNPNDNESPFGPLIYAYTRKQTVADGMQVDVTATAKDAGIRFPLFLTRAVFDAYVTVPPRVIGQDETGRLWDIVWMLQYAIRKAAPRQDRLPFVVYVRNMNRRPRRVHLLATCGPLDIDDPQPAISAMLPNEN